MDKDIQILLDCNSKTASRIKRELNKQLNDLGYRTLEKYVEKKYFCKHLGINETQLRNRISIERAMNNCQK